MENIAAVVLAAGEGTRMHSNRPKVLQEVTFKPMIDWVLDAVEKAEIRKICVVAGFAHEQLEAHLNGRCEIAIQKEQLGTGHAVKSATDFLREKAPQDTIVLCGDAPFISADDLLGACETHRAQGNAVTILSARVHYPHGYGRVLRDGTQTVQRIVEEKDADDMQRRINEVNSGAYCFRTSLLLEALDALQNTNVQKEYYLTDVVEILTENGKKAGTYLLADPTDMSGANDRRQLATLNTLAKKRILEKLYHIGVEIVDEVGVVIGPEVRIGRDTRILPGTILRGKTTIGSGCVIGPNTLLEYCTVEDDAVINASQARQVEIGAGVTIGPFCNLRPGTKLADKVHVGDFVEVKNSIVGQGTKLPHLSYIGDADVGAGTNFGCGCVTANYDGKKKYRTKVGDHAFIGCHTNLIAPVTVGDNAFTAAGSTVTKPVPDGALAVERAKQTNLDGWVRRKHPERFTDEK